MQFLGTEAFAQGRFDTEAFYTQRLRAAFTHRSLYTQNLCYRAALHTEAVTHTGKPLHRAAFTHKGFYTKKLLQTKALH